MSSFIRVESIDLKNTSQEVRSLVAKLSPENKRDLLRNLAHALVEDAKQNFDDPSNRPEPWADKKVYGPKRKISFEPSNLKKTGSLLKSIKLTYLNSDSAEISASPSYTDKMGVKHSGYGVFHQEGTSKMPRRPFFAVTRTGNLYPEMKSLFETIVFDAFESK